MAFAFTVEDGDGVDGANAYISLAYARDYHEGRGQLATWDGDDVTDTVTAADATANTLTVAGHDFETGDGPVRLTGSDLPAPLAEGTDYWVVVASSSALQLATSYANAIAASPTVVNLTDVGSGAQAIVHPSFDRQRQAIVRATDYIESLFGHRFRGQKASAEQGLHWPALYAYSESLLVEGVPDAVRRACAEYALRALSTDLAPDIEPGGGAVVRDRQSGGGLERDLEYAAGTSVTIPRYPTADRWLTPYLYGAAATRA